MLIAIEGLDGVGKTTVGRIVAERLGFDYLEKPLAAVLESSGVAGDAYRDITRRVNAVDDPWPRLLFHAAGSAFLLRLARARDIVTPRLYLSNWVNNRCPGAEGMLRAMAGSAGIPDLTVILYAHPEARRARMAGRDPGDPDLEDVEGSEEGYAFMRRAAEALALPHLEIDTTGIRPSLVADRAIEAIVASLPLRCSVASPESITFRRTVGG